MPALNRVQLIGNLGRDPEARFTANGRKYATFSVAVDRAWKSADGEKQEATDWFLVNAWGKLADVCLNYLRKGRLVFVEGRLRSERWEDKEGGEIHFRTTIAAQSMQILDRRPEEPEPAETSAEDVAE
ncbi:MAG TPA: single-stranded DNA-binding protein [Anaerolineae bacterium]|nr:single-stranded DNA-binding protein [Anaerolineae bacterium]